MFEESSSDAWGLRFGSENPDLPDLGRLLNHRSVREYSGEPVPESLVRGLVAAAQSAATSSNLQLWSVVSVQEPERRKALAELCADQKQVHEAAWFFAFVADHNRLREAARAVGEQAEGLDTVEMLLTACIDAALAAERMVCAAEAIGLGTCYIGALRNKPWDVAELLALPAGAVGLFGLCLGWPAEGSRASIKPRLGQESVWFREVYGAAEIGEYDERMRAFYEEQGMKGDVTWSMRSGRRVGDGGLSGREVWKRFLEERGFGRR